MRSTFIRSGWLPVCGLLFGSTFALGQGPGRLPLTRADDNVMALRQDSLHRTTPFPGLKAIPLNTAKTVHISVGGEIRQQLQVFNNENWGGHVSTETTTNDGTPFLLQRYVLNTNLQLGNYVRVFGELKSGFENGRKNGFPATDRCRQAGSSPTLCRHHGQS